MTDIIIETQNMTQNLTQATGITYLQTPIITDTLPCLIAGSLVTGVGGFLMDFVG